MFETSSIFSLCIDNDPKKLVSMIVWDSKQVHDASFFSIMFSDRQIYIDNIPFYHKFFEKLSIEHILSDCS